MTRTHKPSLTPDGLPIPDREVHLSGGAQVSTYVAKLALLAAAKAGIPERTVYAASGISPEALAEETALVPADAVVSLWLIGATLTKDPCFGLRCAEAVDPVSEHLLFYLLGSCATVGQAFEIGIRYESLLHQVATTRILRDASSVTLRMACDSPLIAFGASQFGFAVTARFIEAVTDGAVRPSCVRFVHDPPADPSAYRRHFGSSVLFGQSHYELSYPIGVLDLPVQTADLRLRNLLFRVADVEREKLPPQDPLDERIRREILQALAANQASLEEIAARVDMSTRTLQRRLRERQTTYFDLMEDVRKEAAKRLLAGPGLPISEVARLLGFSDAASFGRAFQRWFGKAPRDWKRDTEARCFPEGSQIP